MGGMALSTWEEWFTRAAALVVASVPANGVAVFYQSDICVDGRWVDKGHLVTNGAQRHGARLLFHRVVCRKPPGTVTFGRAAWAHLMAFSCGVVPQQGRSWADVLVDGGPSPWTRGMGTLACAEACRFVLQHTATRTVVDPFCGMGTVLAVANELGMDAVGVELSARRARRARALVTPGMTCSRSAAAPARKAQPDAKALTP